MWLPDELLIDIAKAGPIYRMIEVVPRLREQLVSELYDTDPEGTIDYSIRSGQLTLFHHLHQLKKFELKSWMLSTAVKAGSLEMVELLYNHDVMLSFDPIAVALSNDHLEIAKYFIEQGHVPDDNTMNAVSVSGNLNAVMQLIGWGVIATEKTLVSAVYGAHLELIRYLHQECNIPITTQAITAVATFGYYEVAKYLLDHWDGKVIPAMMSLAANSPDVFNLFRSHGGVIDENVLLTMISLGDLDTIEEYYRMADEQELTRSSRSADYQLATKLHDDTWKNNAVNEAALSGNMKLIEFLIGKGAKLSTETLNKSICSKRLNTIRQLHEQHGLQFNETSNYFAVLTDQLEIVMYVIERNTIQPSSDLLEIAINHTRLDVVKYLIGRGVSIRNIDLSVLVHTQDIDLIKQSISLGYRQEDLPEAIAGAAADNQFALVDYLHSLLDSRVESLAVDRAARKGHLSMVQHLYSLGYRVVDIGNVAAAGELSIMKFLVSKGEVQGETSMIAAAMFGHLEMVKYLDSINVPLTEISLSASMSRGHLSVAIYIDQRGVKMRPPYIGRAISGDHLSIVRYFSKYFNEELFRREHDAIVDQLNLLGYTHMADDVSRMSPYDAVCYLLNELTIFPDINLDMFGYYIYHLTIHVRAHNQDESIMTRYLKSILNV